MEQLTLEQAATNYAPLTAERVKRESFKAGAEWQKEQYKEPFQRIIKLVDSLVYYSQIHTVTGVRPANAATHTETWKEAQLNIHLNNTSKDVNETIYNPEANFR